MNNYDKDEHFVCLTFLDFIESICIVYLISVSEMCFSDKSDICIFSLAPFPLFIFYTFFFKVLSLIRSCPYPQGISTQELKQRLSGIGLSVIK